MKQKGINRIVVGVWDFEKGKEYFENFLELNLRPKIRTEKQQRSEYGSQWHGSPELNSYPHYLMFKVPYEMRWKKNGEGIKGVVFAVDDADYAMSQGSALGLQSHYDLDYDQSQIDSKCQGRFTKYKEYFISAPDPLNTTLLLGEFNEKEPKSSSA